MMNIKIKLEKEKISAETIVWFLIMMFYYEPQYFSEIEFLDRVYFCGKIATFFMIPFIIFYNRDKYRISKFMFFIIFAEIWLFISSILINNNSLIAYFNHTITLCLFLLMLDYMMAKNIKKCLSVMLLIYELLIYGCLFTMLLFPNGLYGVIGASRKHWLLGHVNSNIIYILQGLMIAMLYSYYVCGRLLCNRVILLLGAGIYMIVKPWAANSLVGILIFGIVVILGLLKIRIKLLWVFAGSIVMWIGFSIFKLQDMFAIVIENILHRDLTFSRRIKVWNSTLTYISQKPVFGWGIESSEETLVKFGFLQTHNKFFHLLYMGGIVLLLVFLALVIHVIYCLSNRANTYAYIIITACLSAFLIMIIFESYITALFFVPFVFAYHIKEIESI